MVGCRSHYDQAKSDVWLEFSSFNILSLSSFSSSQIDLGAAFARRRCDLLFGSRISKLSLPQHQRSTESTVLTVIFNLLFREFPTPGTSVTWSSGKKISATKRPLSACHIASTAYLTPGTILVSTVELLECTSLCTQPRLLKYSRRSAQLLSLPGSTIYLAASIQCKDPEQAVSKTR